MRFTKSFALLAILALSILTPFAAFAGPKAQTLEALPNLTIQHDVHASATALAIVNDGTAAAGPFHVQMTVNGVPFSFVCYGLAPGEVLGMQLPGVGDGKPASISITLDCGDGIVKSEVRESNEDDNTDSFMFQG
jgi:hypothetical protein